MRTKTNDGSGSEQADNGQMLGLTDVEKMLFPSSDGGDGDDSRQGQAGDDGDDDGDGGAENEGEGQESGSESESEDEGSSASDASDEDEGTEDSEEEQSEEEPEESEESEESEDEPYSKLTKKELQTLIVQQERGVEKLKTRVTKLQEELDAEREGSATVKEQAQILNYAQQQLDDPEACAVMIGRQIAYAAKKHGLDPAALVEKALKGEKGPLSSINVDELLEGAIQAADLDEESAEGTRDVLKHLLPKLLGSIEAALPKASPDTKSAPAESSKDVKRREVEAKFQSGLEEAKAFYRDDTPKFRLTETMARQAVDEYRTLPVQKAVELYFGKELRALRSRTGRANEKKTDPVPMVRGTGNKRGSRPPADINRKGAGMKDYAQALGLEGN